MHDAVMMVRSKCSVRHKVRVSPAFLARPAPINIEDKVVMQETHSRNIEEMHQETHFTVVAGERPRLFSIKICTGSLEGEQRDLRVQHITPPPRQVATSKSALCNNETL